MSEGELSKTIEWNSRLEEYFSSTGEKAHCLSWIHKRAESLYSKRKTFIDLPVIVLSGVLGFLSVGSSTMFAGDETTASVSVGIGSLFVSVLNTVGSYFQWSKRAEGHRIASIQYAKLYRFLNIELSLPRNERMSPSDLLKLTKESYDRLQEISPLVPPEVLEEFKKKFDDPKYKDISRPEETNGLEKIIIYSPSGNSFENRSEVSYENPMLRPHQTLGLSRIKMSRSITTGANTSTELGSLPNDLPSPSPTFQLQPLTTSESDEQFQSKSSVSP